MHLLRALVVHSTLIFAAVTLLLAPAAAPLGAAETKAAPAAVRIKAGITQPLTDETGRVWQPDQGFYDGETIERPGIGISRTSTPSLYRAERYSMTKFTYAVPNGHYIVKLHFAETYEGINGPGQRVFSYTVEGKAFKDFDIFKTTGGLNRAYVETVEVEIKDGQLDLTFTPNIENPQINALEILPAPAK